MTPATDTNNKSKTIEFWNNFFETEHSFRSLSPRDRVEAMNSILNKYYSDISLEAYTPKDGTETLCISAHGREEHFPLVMELVNQAPPSDRYQIAALRPRSPSANFAIGMSEDFKLNTSDILVGHYADAAQVGLEIRFSCEIPQGFEDHARHMAFIMLDHVIGEYDFSVKVGAVDFVDAWSDAPVSSTSLDNFPPVFDSFWKNELGHTNVFPQGEHTWAGLEVTYNTDDEQEETALVWVNRCANALAMRADMSQVLTLTLPASDDDELNYAHEKQDQIEHLLARSCSGICAYSMIKSGQRHVIFYVSDAVSARALIEETVSGSPFELQDEYDFRWSKYCQFAAALASTR